MANKPKPTRAQLIEALTVLANAADRQYTERFICNPWIRIWKNHGKVIEAARAEQKKIDEKTK
jgi:hypothetical protein